MEEESFSVAYTLALANDVLNRECSCDLGTNMLKG
jgi:hypothetical protein